MTALTEPPGPPGAEPAELTGIRIGYARVSTGGQKLDRQTDALRAAGCRRIFADKQSGKDTDRAELRAALEFLQPGDTLVVPALDRLSRSLQDLITTVADLRRRGVGFTSLHEALDTTTPGGRLVFHVFAALAEFIRELIVAGTCEGLAAARERGPHRRAARRRQPHMPRRQPAFTIQPHQAPDRGLSRQPLIPPSRTLLTHARFPRP